MTVLKLRVHARSRYYPEQFLLSQHVYRHCIPPLISPGDCGDALRLMVCSQLDHTETESSWLGPGITQGNSCSVSMSTCQCISAFDTPGCFDDNPGALSVQCAVCLTIGCSHTVHIYLEFHNVCPLVGIGSVYPPPLPPTKGRAHSPAGERVG